MKVEFVKIGVLQPTDKLRHETVSFLETLEKEEIERIAGLPQAWLIGGRLYISDGNNRAGVIAAKGAKLIKVEHKKQTEDCYRVSDILLDRAEELRKIGIYNLFDLWDYYQSNEKL